jgi:uncharacterized protein
MVSPIPLPIFVTAQWRHLVMLNYEVDPAILAELVPRGTELDVWQGRALVSLVGFRFLETRVRGLAIPGHLDFEELNLRFYVRRQAADGWRRGVVFVKEVVPRWAIAWVARTVYNENYVALPMRHRILSPLATAGNAGSVSYEWFHGGRWNQLAAEFRGMPALPALDAEETFITEHYWGYARQRDGGTVEYQVEHPRWRVWPATATRWDCDVALFYGERWAPFLTGLPSSAMVAEGSEIVVRRGVRLAAG